MESLSKEEIEKEIISIGESIDAHKAQIKLHEYAIRVDSYILEKFK